MCPSSPPFQYQNDCPKALPSFSTECDPPGCCAALVVWRMTLCPASAADSRISLGAVMIAAVTGGNVVGAVSVP